jgi:hypothetical protein
LPLRALLEESIRRAPTISFFEKGYLYWSKMPLGPLEGLRSIDDVNREKTKSGGGRVMKGKKRSLTPFEWELERYKYEVAAKLGLKEKVEELGWKNLTARECGRVGGKMGGKIGGRTVLERIKKLKRQD